MFKKVLAALGLIVLSSCIAVAKEMPLRFNYEGSFASTESVNLQFYLSTGTSLSDRLPINDPWTETITVTPENGIINHVLGSINKIPRSIFKENTGIKYLEIISEGNSSYIELVSVPYAGQAEYAREAERIRSKEGKILLSNDTQVLGNLKVGEYCITLGTAITPGYNEIRMDGSPTGGISGSYITSENLPLVIRSTGTAKNITLVTESGNIIINPQGNVGIGDSNPQGKLVINGSVLRSGSTTYGNASNTHICLGVQSATGSSGYNIEYCTIGGGYGNNVKANYSTIGGGYNNTADNNYTTIAGGLSNYVNGEYSTISGGENNLIGAVNYGYVDSIIGGGNDNRIYGYGGTISGGISNRIYGNYATIGGGYGNYAKGNNSTIPGGSGNSTYFEYGFAAGHNAVAYAPGACVIADSYGLTVSTANVFGASFIGGYWLMGGNIGVGKINPQYKLDVYGIINASAVYINGSPLASTAWVNTSSGICYSGGSVEISGNLTVGGNIEKTWNRIFYKELTSNDYHVEISTGLNGNNDIEYKIYCNFKQKFDRSSNTIYMYFNDDYSSDHYIVGRTQSNGTTVTSSNWADARMYLGSMYGGSNCSFIECTIMAKSGTYRHIISNASCQAPGYGLYSDTIKGYWKNDSANIYKITFVSGYGGYDFDAGSYVEVWARR